MMSPANTADSFSAGGDGEEDEEEDEDEDVRSGNSVDSSSRSNGNSPVLDVVVFVILKTIPGRDTKIIIIIFFTSILETAYS